MVINAPKEYQKLEYTLCLMSTLFEIQAKIFGRWPSHQRTQ